MLMEKLTGLQWGDIDLAERFDQDRGFSLKHDLVDHPLLRLEALVVLARTLPPSLVEYNIGELGIHQDPTLTPRNGLSPEETVERIATCRSWMVLKDVEADPAYKALIDQCLAPIEKALGPLAQGMYNRHGFVFVSSPDSVTPFHVDFEQNFLMQIRGKKFITVFNDQDRLLLPEVRRELAVLGAPRNMEYHEDFAVLGKTYEMNPGDAVNVPLSSPHWVKVGEEVSVSFSVTFQTRVTERIRSAHALNHRMRSRGLHPKDVGQSLVRDEVKLFSEKVLRRLVR
jgi:hypothetical protein